MLDLCAGFVYSQVLFTCVRLRLFDILFKEPLTTAALAERLSLSPEATCRLLDAAVSICPLWPSGLVPGSLMPDSWSELRSMEAIS
jgi:hypothetical protein